MSQPTTSSSPQAAMDREHAQPADRGEQAEHGDLERSIDALIAIGRMWASHGLRMGKSALQTSARTLDVTAQTLTELADRFEPEPRREPRGDSPE